MVTWRNFVGRRLCRHGQPVRVVALQRVVVAGVFWRARLALAAAAAATTTQAATEVATRQDAAQHEQRFAPRTGHHEVSVDVLLAELLRYVQTERAVIVVDVPFGRIAKDGVRSVHLLKFVCGVWIVRILVWMVFKRKFSVTFFHIVGGRRFRQLQNFIETVATRRQLPFIHFKDLWTKIYT